jgi:hypothetical protein
VTSGSVELAGPGSPPRRFLRLQALDDAIAYRRARVAAACPDCGPGTDGPRCDDHACDLSLISAYQAAALDFTAEITSARRR